MSDDYRDNYSSHSIDAVRRKPNKGLEIIIEENNSFNHDLNNQEGSESKTQINFYNNNNQLPNKFGKRNNSVEKRRRSELLHEKVRNILDNKSRFNLEAEEDLDEKELKNEANNNQKKKVQKKVNRNLKLLNLIKERMGKTEDSGDKKDEKKSEINSEKISGEKEVEEKKEEVKNEDKAIKENKENKGIEDNEESRKNEENKKEENNDSITENVSYKIIVKDDNKIEKNVEPKNIEEEKIQKLLKLFDNKKFKKLQNRDSKSNSNNNNKEEEEEKYKEEKIKNIKSIPHPNLNSPSVTYPAFVKRGVGNFHINTPKSRIKNVKNQENEKEKDNKSEKTEKSDKKEEKFTEIPQEQRDKLTINLSSKKITPVKENNEDNNLSSNKVEKNLINNLNSNSNNKIMDKSDKKKDEQIEKEEENNKYETEKKEEKENSNNSNVKKNNNNNSISTSKKGAMKILELLKAKKKEENENILRARSQERPLKNINQKSEEEDEYEDEKKEKKKAKENSYSHHKKSETKNGRNSEGKYDINSLPKKTFRDEEDEEENNFNDSYNNKTQQPFRSNKKNSNNKERNNENNMSKKRHYINNINNINNNINNFFNLNNPPNYPERKTLNYINNANNLRNRYNKKMNAYNSFQSGKNSPQHFFETKNSMYKHNLKSLDNSFDIAHVRKNVGRKRFNNNYNSINVSSNNNIYEPKKISNNNSPIRYNPHQINNVNNLNSMKNIMKERVYNKINSKKSPAYIKKSPGRIKKLNNSNYIYKNNNTKNNSKGIVRNIYNLKSKNNNNLFKNSENNNYLNSNINNSNNLGSLEISSIYGVNSSTDTYTTNRFDYINTNYNNSNYYYSNQNTMKNNSIDSKKENSMLFNLEDLMVLEERLSDITFSLESNKNIERQCFNFWNYYYNCSLYKILEKIFPNEEDSNIIRLSINYELMSIMICYEFSFELDLFDEDLILSLLELIYFNHDNLMIICEYILTKITPENKGNIWVLKLQEIVHNSKMSQVKEVKNNYLLTPINKINNNTNKISQKIRNILLNYNTDYSYVLKKYFLKIDSKSYEQINDFFRNNILRENNFEGSIVASSYLKKNKYFKPFPAPYITEPSTKPYTLILDLDETLINFKIKSSKEGTLRARPFLFGFLEEMGHYYELIVWTSATESYANSLIDAIESEKQYFDYVLFREHAIIIGEDFVKDLNRVGRSLDRVIIVDDMPQNFRLQKQNGITIKPFLGDDYNDTALYDLLPILKHIAEEGNDARLGLQKYRDEIVKKITSNISKHNI